MLLWVYYVKVEDPQRIMFQRTSVFTKALRNALGRGEQASLSSLVVLRCWQGLIVGRANAQKPGVSIIIPIGKIWCSPGDSTRMVVDKVNRRWQPRRQPVRCVCAHACVRVCVCVSPPGSSVFFSPISGLGKPRITIQ